MDSKELLYWKNRCIFCSEPVIEELDDKGVTRYYKVEQPEERHICAEQLKVTGDLESAGYSIITPN
jgi:hypothetical protein